MPGRAGLVVTARGRITILDHEALEENSNGTYIALTALKSAPPQRYDFRWNTTVSAITIA